MADVYRGMVCLDMNNLIDELERVKAERDRLRAENQLFKNVFSGIHNSGTCIDYRGAASVPPPACKFLERRTQKVGGEFGPSASGSITTYQCGVFLYHLQREFGPQNETYVLSCAPCSRLRQTGIFNATVAPPANLTTENSLPEFGEFSGPAGEPPLNRSE